MYHYGMLGGMTEWRDIPGHEGCYQVSDAGSVRSLDRQVERRRKNGVFLWKLPGRVLSPGRKSDGHMSVVLYRDGVGKTRCVHSLVLEAFVGPCPEEMECCHNDGNPANNSLVNLRWDTHRANVLDSVTHGVHGQSRKTHCIRNHELPPSINGVRHCEECKRDHGYKRLRKGKSP